MCIVRAATTTLQISTRLRRAECDLRTAMLYHCAGPRAACSSLGAIPSELASSAIRALWHLRAIRKSCPDRHEKCWLRNRMRWQMGPDALRTWPVGFRRSHELQRQRSLPCRTGNQLRAQRSVSSRLDSKSVSSCEIKDFKVRVLLVLTITGSARGQHGETGNYGLK